MSAMFRFFPASICADFKKFTGSLAALLFVLPMLGVVASAQNTTISGKVYDPRTSANGGLPLPGVLVYATTGTVPPLTPGVQCLTSTSSAPTGAGIVSYTNSAVDGTFTLPNVPENATYTVVIQAGKWRRQYTETVAAAPLTGIELDMPSNHTQGDIPLIAISTGSVDALECVVRDMGIADTEFTDDNGTVNAGGRIHLYKGSEEPGVVINASTPLESTLMTNPTTMNSYDVLMFPCQGTPAGQASTAGATNLSNYANAGGRVFATHYSYAWLDPASPYDSQFLSTGGTGVATWVPDTSLSNGTATINTGFNDGATLAQWLLNAGASTSYGQVTLTTLKNDISAVIPPTQAWATLNSNHDIMQMTFNTPVGAPAANQCGRVLYNEYHVYNVSVLPGEMFPTECSGIAKTMTPQEEMLEYALFDLSSFVTPVIVPSLTIGFTPNPLVVNQAETGVQLTVNVANTSTSTPIDATAVLTLVLPAGLTPTALTDSTGGWICTLSTLTCIRSSGIPASSSDSVTLTVSVPLYPAGGQPATGVINATVSSPDFSNNVTGTGNVIFQQPPGITWATPAPIVYGTPLSGTQLDASSTLPGSFAYSPTAGTVLGVGQQTLKVTFTPTDTVDYTTSTGSVVLTVTPATPTITVTASANPAFASNPVTLTATVSSLGVTPTGTVTFYDGTTVVGTGTLTAGVATVTTSTLTGGTQSITAVYSGDSSYAGSTSGTFSETIEDFTLALQGSVTVGPVTTYTLVITPVGASTLGQTLTMSVTGTPLGVTPVFTPPTVPASSGTTDVTLQMESPPQLGRQQQRRPLGGGALPMALGLILLPFAGLMRKTASRWDRMLVLALIGIALAVGVSGCGTVVLTTQTSTVTITATSGSLSHSVTASLSVQ